MPQNALFGLAALTCWRRYNSRRSRNHHLAYVRHNRTCVFVFLSLFPFKAFSVLFSLCANLHHIVSCCKICHRSCCVLCFIVCGWLAVLCIAEPLQQSNPIELFQWLPKEHMCILVYLVWLCTSVRYCNCCVAVPRTDVSALMGFVYPAILTVVLFIFHCLSLLQLIFTVPFFARSVSSVHWRKQCSCLLEYRKHSK